MAFEDVASRTEVLGSKGVVKRKLLELRREERERFVAEWQEEEKKRRRKRREEEEEEEDDDEEEGRRRSLE